MFEQSTEQGVGDRGHGQVGAGWLCSPDQVRRLAEEDLLRGALRRRFAYEPPDGWLGVSRGNQTVWTPADPGRGPTRLTVWPTSPRGADEQAVIDELLAEQHGWYELEGPVPLRTREGLSGHLWEIVVVEANGARRCCDLVVLQDERCLYPLRLETTSARPVRDLVDLFEVVHSALPLS